MNDTVEWDLTSGTERGRADMKVSVDETRCTGHGECVRMAPAVFSLDNSDVSQVLIEEPDESLRQQVFDAEVLCPVGAITVGN